MKKSEKSEISNKDFLSVKFGEEKIQGKHLCSETQSAILYSVTCIVFIIVLTTVVVILVFKASGSNQPRPTRPIITTTHRPTTLPSTKSELSTTSTPPPPETTSEPETIYPTTLLTTTSPTTTTEPSTTTESTTDAPTTTTPTPNPVTILRRRIWSTIPGWALKTDKMPHPVKEIFLGDTGRFGQWICDTLPECEKQALHLEQLLRGNYPYGDILYNFMIPNMDTIFEGRGWTYDSAFYHLTPSGEKMLFIAMMGNFQQFPPTELQMELLWALISEGVRNGYVDPDYRIYAECQKGFTTSPGTEFLYEIREMDRWSNFSYLRPLNDCKR